MDPEVPTGPRDTGLTRLGRRLVPLVKRVAVSFQESPQLAAVFPFEPHRPSPHENAAKLVRVETADPLFDRLERSHLPGRVSQQYESSSLCHDLGTKLGSEPALLNEERTERGDEGGDRGEQDRR